MASLEKNAAFVAKLLAPVDLAGNTFLREIQREENASFHRLWVDAEAVAHAYQSAHWAALSARFYNRVEAREAGLKEAVAKVRAYSAVSALMECPAMKQQDIAHKRRVYRLCGHGGTRWMKPWDDALALDEERLSAMREA